MPPCLLLEFEVYSHLSDHEWLLCDLSDCDRRWLDNWGGAGCLVRRWQGIMQSWVIGLLLLVARNCEGRQLLQAPAPAPSSEIAYLDTLRTALDGDKSESGTPKDLLPDLRSLLWLSLLTCLYSWRSTYLPPTKIVLRPQKAIIVIRPWKICLGPRSCSLRREALPCGSKRRDIAYWS